MAISTSDLRKLITAVKAAIPDLEQIVAAREAAGEAQGVLDALRGDIASITAYRDRLKAEVEAEQKVIEQERERTKQSRAKAEKSAMSRLEDLERKVKDTQALVDAGANKLVEQRQAHDRAQAEHLAALKEIEQRGLKAATELLQTQEKIKALHAHLAGATA